VCCSVLQCVPLCCSLLRKCVGSGIAIRVLQSVLQCIAVYCSVLGGHVG